MTVVVGCSGRGVVTSAPLSFPVIREVATLNGAVPGTIVAGRDGKLWIGTLNGRFIIRYGLNSTLSMLHAGLTSVPNGGVAAEPTATFGSPNSTSIVSVGSRRQDR